MNEKGCLKFVHPVLPVKDVLEALHFYVEKLGFVIAFADDPKNPRYAGIRRDEIEIHLQWHDSAEWELTFDRPMLRILVEGVETLFEEYKEMDVFQDNTGLHETLWGTREFAFYDPFRNGLTFYCDL